MIELRPHQIKAVYEMHNGCILKGGVGSGKTLTALAYYYMRVLGATAAIKHSGVVGTVHEPIDLYVITTAKKRDDLDWIKEAAHFAISPDREASWGGVKLTVDSWNNIQRYAKVKDAFFIFDEQRLVGKGAWAKTFIKLAKQNKWVVLSATPGDVWMDYVPIFIARGFFNNRTHFITEHVVYNTFSKFPKIDRYVNTKILEKYRRAIIVDMPYIRHTQRHMQLLPVEHDQELYKKVWVDRWHVYEDRPVREVGELFYVIRKVVNSDPDRLVKLVRTMQKHPRLIVFYNFTYELDLLREGLQPLVEEGLELKEWNGQKHEQVPEGKAWVYLVQYTAGSEGWNCTTTDAVLFYSLTYSYKQYEQAQGRVDRMNTPFTDLYYYTLRSSTQIDKSIAKALATKQNFSERSLVDGR